MSDTATAAAFAPTVYVESSSEPGAFWLVELPADAPPHCRCPSFTFHNGPEVDGHRACRHIEQEVSRRRRLRAALAESEDSAA